mmetsp:Transcript_50952/g.75588  ORF Transcript_50952/g.75588 Transcript_50952/m.75588 type:complete len:1124 (-) Transcript_50952:484-3855(-)|eukprot:CAMPEP_0195524224 /NCGR_PEP_ID=MMETSP0794_2-20130614/23930_1 /TAXON_ID=515487 /ORGANISM="Stephanopyxis turris, Strain CCMP 815" /LENGTH=1123 /DNA_ID=CAMNT_0040654401 /DNA_START=42 /DNA_END=3413 /DNA_ORIENTATION=+
MHSSGSTWAYANCNEKTYDSRDDDGTPSDDVHADLIRVLALIEDERHLVAYDLYRDAKNRVELAEALDRQATEVKAHIASSSENGFCAKRNFHPQSTSVLNRASSIFSSPSSRTDPSTITGADNTRNAHRPSNTFDSCSSEWHDGNTPFPNTSVTTLESDDHGLNDIDPFLPSRNGTSSMGSGLKLSKDIARTSLNKTDDSGISSSPYGMLKSILSSFVFRNHSFHEIKMTSPEEKTLPDTGTRIPKQLEISTAPVIKARHLLNAKEADFKSLVKRAILFQKAKENLTVDDDWTFSQTTFGVTTHYRREEDGTLSIKLEGGLKGVPLFEQLAVLRECDLFHTWSPFCSESRKLAQLGKIEAVGWFNVFVPLLGLSRDAVYRAMGCDTMREDGSIMLLAEGIKPPSKVDRPSLDKPEDRHIVEGKRKKIGIKRLKKSHRILRKSLHEAENIFSASKNHSGANNNEGMGMRLSNGIDDRSSKSLGDDAVREESRGLGSSLSLDMDSDVVNVDIPSPPTKFGAARMNLLNFSAIIDVLSPDSARTKIVANMDPNVKFVPQSLIDFFLKKICGVMLVRIQATARKIIQDPIKSPHAKRMRLDAVFYRDWLLPKFKAYCDELGWIMPPVAAFEIDYDALDDEEIEANGGCQRDEHSVTSDPGIKLARHGDLCNPRPNQDHQCDSSSLPTSKKNITLVNPFLELQQKIDDGPKYLSAIKSPEAKERERKRKIETTRKQVAEKLRAIPLMPEQQRRYEELQRTKRRIEEEKAAANEKVLDRTRKKNYLKYIRQLSRKMAWPIVGKLISMFFVYYSNGPIYRWVKDELNGWCGLLAVALLAGIYGAMHVAVVYSICLFAFDAVEPHVSVVNSGELSDLISPLLALESRVTIFHSGRYFFRRTVLKYTIKFSLVIVLICSFSTFIAVAYQNYYDNILTTEVGVAIFNGLTDSDIPSFDHNTEGRSDLVESAPLGLVRGTISESSDFFLFGGKVAKNSVRVAIETMMCSNSINVWKSDALELIKWVMANSAAFLASLVIIGILLLGPKEPSQKKKIKKDMFQEHVSTNSQSGVLPDNLGEMQNSAGELPSQNRQNEFETLDKEKLLQIDSSQLSSSQVLHRQRLLKAHSGLKL